LRYAETGYNLEVDLTRGSIEREQTDPELTRLHLGGQGTAAKILWDRVGPEVEPFSPDNLLIFSSGLLNGTAVAGATRTMVNTFSPQTNFVAHSMMGSYFGAEMKFAGYDKIIVSGKSPKLVYLWINNDKVEIRDASHLAGKGTRETGDLIRQELNNDKIQVAAIGLAGENRVFTASIDHSDASAARGGAGAIMGDKKLKAIAILGTKDIYVAKPAELFDLCMAARKAIMAKHEETEALARERGHSAEYVQMAKHREQLGDWMATDEDDSFHHNNFAWGNARKRIRGFWSKELEERWRKLKFDNLSRQTGCFNCPKICHNVIQMPGGPRFSYKCYAKDTFHMAAFQELDFTFEIYPYVSSYGVDAYSTAQIIAFALELLEAGILTENDFPGMPADIRARFHYLLDKIVRRDGIGDVLANGVYAAARQIGKGAEKYDHNTTKKFEQLPIKLGKVNPAYFLMIATSEKPAITQIEGSFPQDPFPVAEEREAFAREWTAAPDEKFRKMFVNWVKRDQVSNEDACAIVEWNEMMHYIDDSLGLCAFLSSFRGQFGGKVAYHIHNAPQFITTATGMPMDEATLWEIGTRNRTLVRALNVRRGMRRKDERPPEDHWAVGVDGKPRNEEWEQKLLSDYYAYRGWNEEGIPTAATLNKLGLDYVRKELEERSILPKS
jgi:aldehyde:ferredoxin oxidoreductase